MEPLTISTIREKYWDSETKTSLPISIIEFQGHTIDVLGTDNFVRYQFIPDGSLITGLNGQFITHDWLSSPDAENGPYHTVFDRNTFYFLGGRQRFPGLPDKPKHLQICYLPRNVVAEDCMDSVFCWVNKP
jgi:hypothetical protein